MKITLFTTNEACEEIISVDASHISMFEKQELNIHFISTGEQGKFITALIKHYVLS